MNATGNETLDRIQQEIKESLDREEELRKKYQNNNNNPEETNGYMNGRESPQPPKMPLQNGSINHKTNGSARRFAPNPLNKGVMEKFLKLRGKLNVVTMKPATQPQNSWTQNEPIVMEPLKVTIVQKEKPGRNGFIPAEEKMKRELREFQMREDELRKERRKSQPDLMAALEAEHEIEGTLKPKSAVLMYSCEDLRENGFGSNKLKPARSLADLCDASDEELETPGTHSLIMQFENLHK